jgi:putative ABC transport system ATP-binding protein
METFAAAAPSPAAPAGAQVSVERVTKRFGERVTALREVSLRLESGELVLLSGPSGSGKTTLLNLIAGFDAPDEGRVLVDDRPVAEQADLARFRREVIGVVFQQHHLIDGLTAEENVEVALLPCALRRSERRERVATALADVGLAERAEHLPSQLSGGERQRVAVARALVNGPRLLLADEPTGALDSAASEEVMALLREVRDRRGMTVLLISHEPDAARYVGRTVLLRDGRVVE